MTLPAELANEEKEEIEENKEIQQVASCEKVAGIILYDIISSYHHFISYTVELSISTYWEMYRKCASNFV